MKDIVLIILVAIWVIAVTTLIIWVVTTDHYYEDDRYRKYKQTALEADHQILDYKTLISVIPIVAEKISWLKYPDCDGSYIKAILYKLNGHTYHILLSEKDYKKFSKWAEQDWKKKVQKAQKQRESNMVLADIQKEVTKEIERCQKVKADAFQKYIDLQRSVVSNEAKTTVMNDLDAYKKIYMSIKEY